MSIELFISVISLVISSISLGLAINGSGNNIKRWPLNWIRKLLASHLLKTFRDSPLSGMPFLHCYSITQIWNFQLIHDVGLCRSIAISCEFFFCLRIAAYKQQGGTYACYKIFLTLFFPIVAKIATVILSARFRQARSILAIRSCLKNTRMARAVAAHSAFRWQASSKMACTTIARQARWRWLTRH